MSTVKKKLNFFDTEEGVAAKKTLIAMVTDAAYHTDDSYSANSDLYPSHQIPFVDKHMEYLRNHPSLDPQHYLANLRMMTRIRR